MPEIELRQRVNAETGHVLITVSPDFVAAADAPGVAQILVCDAGGRSGGGRSGRQGFGLGRRRSFGGAAGYDAVIADPGRRAADRLGLRGGGRVMVRPDSYLGYVADLDDTGYLRGLLPPARQRRDSVTPPADSTGPATLCRNPVPQPCAATLCCNNNTAPLLLFAVRCSDSNDGVALLSQESAEKP